MGKEKGSVHWPGLPFHAWPRTRRGLKILMVLGLPGCYKATFAKEGGFCDCLSVDSTEKELCGPPGSSCPRLHED